MARPTTKVKCEVCGTLFDKENREIVQTEKRNGVHCCSKICGNFYVATKSKEKSNPFNYYLISIRKRNKQKFNDDKIVTAEYLESVWCSQEGKCAITGIPMVHNKQRSDKNIYQASVDRIDDTLGYIEGNIQFTTVGANYMRNTFSMEEVLQFVSDIQTYSYKAE